MKKILFSLMTMAAVLSVAGTGSLAYFTDTETSTGNSFTAGVWEVPPLQVVIDIRPQVYPNVIVLCDDCDCYIEYIPVAILTTDDFDAATVDPATVRFGPAQQEAECYEYPENWKIDVDGDGDLDMLLYFETDYTGIEYGHTQAELTGETWCGMDIHGSDSVKVLLYCDCEYDCEYDCEDKSEDKPEDKHEDKPEDKYEDKPDQKPEDEHEQKTDEKPEDDQANHGTP